MNSAPASNGIGGRATTDYKQAVFAGSPPGGTIEASVLWQPTVAADVPYQAFAQLPVATADANGGAEIDAVVPTSDLPGTLCFVRRADFAAPRCTDANTAVVAGQHVA